MKGFPLVVGPRLRNLTRSVPLATACMYSTILSHRISGVGFSWGGFPGSFDTEMNKWRLDVNRAQPLAKIEAMRCALILALAGCTAATAQNIVNPKRLRGFIAEL